MDFFELFKLYAYVIPQIIFYTMPISFFISLVITLAKGTADITATTKDGSNLVAKLALTVA